MSIFILMSNAYALTLQESISKGLDSSSEVKAELNNQDAYKKYVDDKESGYYPRIDLSAYVESSEINNDSEDDTVEGKSKKTGYRGNLRLEQLLYDGGLTPAEVAKAKHIRDGNEYKTNQNIETFVLNIIDAYNGLLQYNENIELTKSMVTLNENNLLTAKENEEISGEMLDTYEVISKLSFVEEKYLEEETLQTEQANLLKRYLGIEKIEGYVCKSDIDVAAIPSTLEEILQLTLANNYQIKEQIEKIKERRENINISDAEFLPKFNIELQASIDEDLKLIENGEQEELIARLNMNWNLFYGGKDKNRSEQEKIFLKESKEDLDSITKEVLTTAKNTYYNYVKNKARIESLKRYVDANENIVNIYKEEFDSGTRTFVDILDAETELYLSKKNLQIREFALLDNYYNLLYSFSNLSTTVLNSKNRVCEKPVPIKLMKIEKKDDLEELSELITDEAKEEIIPIVVPKFLRDDAIYTLNVASFLSSDSAIILVNDLLSANESFVYKFFNDDKIYNKVIYKRFDSYSEAKAAYKALNPEIIKIHKPYIDKIEKHKNLYLKYIEYNK